MEDVFDKLKRQVRIQDVATLLGYRVNPRAGIHGDYREMQLWGGDRKVDTIVISLAKGGKPDTYFHRDGHGGSVIDFVQENLGTLGCNGGNLWKDTFEAFAKLTSMPLPDVRQDAALAGWQAMRIPPTFDPARYIVRPLSANPDAASLLFGQRALSEDTVKAFTPWVALLRDTYSSYPRPSLAFPYREPGKDAVVGYELRGNGSFKGKAAGTNSSTGAWIVDMTPHGFPGDARNVFFAESAFDIMAFWQHNRLSLDPSTSVFVSTGGQMSPRQVTGIMDHYTRATAVDCFDNDVYGRIYGIRMASLLSGVHVIISKCDDCVRFTANGKAFSLPLGDVGTSSFAREVPVGRRYRMMAPPKGFKDWNDVVMGKSDTLSVTPSKYLRDENLQARRSTFKR